MTRCGYCGEEIEIRHVDGRKVPIHVSGNRCSAYSDGYSKRELEARQATAPSTRYSDYCRKTLCPREGCGKEIYFIRHNGGSVWVDELGWPWPKHACFAKSKEPSWLSFLYREGTNAGNALVGVVVGARWMPSNATRPSRVELAVQGDYRRACVAINTSQSAKFHLGTVVIVDRREARLISSVHDVFQLLDIPVSPTEFGFPREWLRR